MSPTRSQVLEILRTGLFDDLIGKIEGAELECKAQPYAVDAEAGKRELAKDVSALANASGGLILIGIKARSSTSHFGDEIETPRPFARDLVNTSQYSDLVNAWVYPGVEGIGIEWYPSAADSEKGIVAIDVPPQKRNGPFLIAKTLEGDKHVETVFGYAKRKVDKSPPIGVKELQRYLQLGFSYESLIERRLDGFEALLKENAARSPVRDATAEVRRSRIEQRIANAIVHGDLKNRRLLVLTAWPTEQTELKTIFLSSEGSIRRILEHPPTLRDAGWNLETLNQAAILGGELIRVTSGDRKVIDLYRDGTLVFGAPADSEFIAWASKGTEKFNPLALVESVFAVADFYQYVLADLVDRPEVVEFRIDLMNLHLDGKKSSLPPYRLQSYSQGAKEAPNNNWSRNKAFTVAEYNSAAVAYDLVREIYAWFGLEEDKIPYVKETQGIGKTIDTEHIAQIG